MSLIKLSEIKLFISNYNHVLTVIPALFLFLFASELSFISQNSLVLRKLCISIYNQSLCENEVFTNKTLENDVELLSNDWNLWLNISFTIPAIISILYLVSDADRKSNYKIFMLVSLSGFIIYSLICTIAASQKPLTCMYLLLAAQFLNGILGGGTLAFITSCFGYVSIHDDDAGKNCDRIESKYSNRSIKYSILESSILFGRLLASMVSGFILSNKANFKFYQNSSIISLSIFILIFIYKVILFNCLKKNKPVESFFNRNFSRDQLNISSFGDDEEIQSNHVIIEHKPKSKAIDKFLFIKDIWAALTKKRERNIRFYFLMFLFIYFLTTLVAFGISSIDYLFLRKMPISFSQTEYGLFRALNTLSKGVALLIILPILKNYFEISDRILFLIGLVSDIANYIVFSVSSINRNIIWIAPFAYMFANYYIVCLRSFISKLIDKEDIGNHFCIKLKFL
jgi:hypothetical protein